MAKKKSKTKKVKAEIIEAPAKEIVADAHVKDVVTDEPEESTEALSPSDPVAQYMKEVSKYPLLSREEERELAIRYYETGDSDAAEALVTANLRFVVKVALEYAKFGARLIDIIQEGNVGLMHAVKEYNPYKDVKLITYAVWWIRGHIQEYLMKQYSMVKIGTTANQRKLYYRLQKEKENMERLGHGMVIKQLSGQLGIPEDEIEEMSKRMSGKDVSLDTPLNSSGESASTLLDYQSDEDEQPLEDMIGLKEQMAQLTEAILTLKDQLNERELELLDNRLLAEEPMTLQEIGEKNGVSREAVRQMENRLIQKIKNHLLDGKGVKNLN